MIRGVSGRLIKSGGQEVLAKRTAAPIKRLQHGDQTVIN